MGSFTQSKMFHRGVVCSNCHEPHSLKLVAEGNAVCTQCHSAEKFDSPSHHHHEVSNAGAQCANCHMPKHTYMVIDERADHNIRPPRPDLSDKIGTPNACTQCHTNQTNQWATTAVNRWLNAQQKSLTEHYGETLFAGRKGDPAAAQKLIALSQERNQSAIVRATATGLMAPTAESLGAAIASLQDAEPLVRRSAITFLEALPPEQRLENLLPMLNDKIKTVRLEAARVLAVIDLTTLKGAQQKSLEKAFAEYVATQKVNADTPEAQINLGIYYTQQGQLDLALKAYNRAQQLAPAFTASYINMADIYREQGEETKAETVLRKGITIDSKAAQLQHSLGLSLLRQKRYIDAEAALQAAAKLDPNNQNIAEVYAAILDYLGKTDAAVSALEQLPQKSPEILAAMAGYLEKNSDYAGALAKAKKLAEKNPESKELRTLIAKLSAMQQAMEIANKPTETPRLQTTEEKTPFQWWWIILIGMLTALAGFIGYRYVVRK